MHIAAFSALVFVFTFTASRPPRAPVVTVTPMFQTIQNPTTIEFTASPDHAALDKGAPVVSRYDVEIYTQANQTTAVSTINVGKPTPGTGNLISFNQLRTTLGPLPVGTYVAKVAAVGPGGTGRSTSSNPFQEATRQPAVTGTPVIKE